jgi:hypothetical protein
MMIANFNKPAKLVFSSDDNLPAQLFYMLDTILRVNH